MTSLFTPAGLTASSFLLFFRRGGVDGVFLGGCQNFFPVNQGSKK